MKRIFLTIAAIMAATSLNAASIERVGAKVTGENTFIPAVRIVTPAGVDLITTAEYAKGRAIDGATVLPAGTFNPAYMPSAIAWARSNYGNVHVQAGGDLNLDAGGNPVRGHDNW